MGSIGRVFERVSSSVISPTGGIRPPGRRRGQTALRITEVEKISRGSSMRQSLRMIAQHLDCVPSTISHEIKRDGTASVHADRDRDLRPKACKLACHSQLAHAVSAKLRRKWSRPSPVMFFLTKRSSSVYSATTSFESRASRRRSFTSPVVAARAVPPASRFLPASRKSFDHL